MGALGEWGAGMLPVTGLYALCGALSVAHYGLRLLRHQEMGPGKKAARLAAAIGLWAAVGTMALAGDLVRVVDSTAELAAVESPGGRYRLVVTARSPLTFGAHDVDIYISRDGGRGQRIASTRLANDGKAPVAGRNCRVRWTGDERAEVWLWGEEQEAETIAIEVAGDEAVVRAGSREERVALGGWGLGGRQAAGVVLSVVPFGLLGVWNVWVWRRGARFESDELPM